MPDVTFQGSLFSGHSESEGFDHSFQDLERIELAEGAWIERQPEWAHEPDVLFATALETLDWIEGVERIRGMEVPRPRLVASFGCDELPADLEVIGEMSKVLSERYGVRLDRITCNLYRDGNDSVAWHGDRIARDRPEAIVAIISLGEPRPFRIRPKGGGSSIGFVGRPGGPNRDGRLMPAHPRPLHTQGSKRRAAHRRHVPSHLRLTGTFSRVWPHGILLISPDSMARSGSCHIAMAVFIL